MRFVLKILVSALLLAGASELARRKAWAGAILISLPLSSILALTWLYLDTHDVGKVSALSFSILWAVLPSLLFFLILPALLKAGWPFPLALFSSCAVMAVGYLSYAYLFQRMQI